MHPLSWVLRYLFQDSVPVPFICPHLETAQPEAGETTLGSLVPRDIALCMSCVICFESLSHDPTHLDRKKQPFG